MDSTLEVVRCQMMRGGQIRLEARVRLHFVVDEYNECLRYGQSTLVCLARL